MKNEKKKNKLNAIENPFLQMVLNTFIGQTKNKYSSQIDFQWARVKIFSSVYKFLKEEIYFNYL